MLIPDTLIWEKSIDGMVTCQRLYNNELPTAGNVSWGKFIWDSYIPPRRSVLLWKILHKRIATEEEVQRRGIQLASCCRFCKRVPGPFILDLPFCKISMVRRYVQIRV